MIQGESFTVRGFTKDGVDISFTLHESLKHKTGGAPFILHVLTVILSLICLHHFLGSFGFFWVFLAVLNVCVVHGFSFVW